MGYLGIWVNAFRLRTLPLALSSIGLGSFLAAFEDKMKWPILILASTTTVFLQILSNLANDYGDSQHGADHAGRIGPARAVQSGTISESAMRKAIILFVVLSLCSGLGLLYLAFKQVDLSFAVFLLLGFLSIAAALKYTMGDNPYGYAGMGDLFVIVFFGFVGVSGTYFCHTGSFRWDTLLPAASCGLLAAGVLNINNIRDMQSDEQAGKKSIPVRIGRSNATVYHWILIVLAVAASLVYVLINYHNPYQFLFLASTPLLVYNGWQITTQKEAKKIDPMLKQMAISTLLFIIIFGIGNML